jgi:hypothetical protein
MQGSYSELMQIHDFADLIHTHVISEEDVDDEPEILNTTEFNVDNEVVAINIDQSALNPSRGHYNHYSTVRSWAGNASVDPQYATVQSWGGQMLSSDDQHYATVRGWKDMKRGQVANLLDNTSVLQGSSRREHDTASIIRQNELSVYSIQDLADIRSIQKGSVVTGEAGGDVPDGKLVGSDSSTDSSAAADYIAYFRSGSGIMLTLLCFMLFFVVHLVRIGSGISPCYNEKDYWLRLWIPRIGGFTDAVYLGVYAGFTFVFAIGVLLRGLWFAGISIRKAHEIHDNMFAAIIRAPMSFYDATPLGMSLYYTIRPSALCV